MSLRRRHKEIYEIESSERSFEEETKLSGFSAAPSNMKALPFNMTTRRSMDSRYNHKQLLSVLLNREAIEDNL